MEKLIFDSVRGVDLNRVSEKIFESTIEKYLFANGWRNEKRSYSQSFPRIKNLDKTCCDLVVESAGKIYLIEVKLLPDRRRGPSRFERSFLDVAYLSNEIKKNNVSGFFVIIDMENTQYFERNGFVEACESHLSIKLKIHKNWQKIRDGFDARLFVAEIIPT